MCKENILAKYTGEVVHGRALGRQVGMPTANLVVQKGELDIEEGVYATRIIFKDKVYIAVTKFGHTPTITDEDELIIEAFILDFNSDIYGEIITVIFDDFIRGLVKYNSLEEVKAQVNIDTKYVLDYYKKVNYEK